MFCLLWTVLLWTFMDSNFNSKSSSETAPITSDTFITSVWRLLIKIYISHQVPLFDPISFSGSLFNDFLSHSFATKPTCLSTLRKSTMSLCRVSDFRCLPPTRTLPSQHPLPVLGSILQWPVSWMWSRKVRASFFTVFRYKSQNTDRDSH